MTGFIFRLSSKFQYEFNRMVILILEVKLKIVNFLTSKKIERQISELVGMLRPINVQPNLIRVGADSDGGYLIPRDCFKCDFLVSPGVDDKVTFELEFAKRGISCHLIDGSISKLPYAHENLKFSKKFLGSENSLETLTLDTILSDLPGDNGVLQMDIEGAEYEVILGCNKLKKFKYICIELHDFYNVATQNAISRKRKALEKLLNDFTCCHIHFNNTDRLIQVGEWQVPNYIELTLVRNDALKNLSVLDQKVKLPHFADRTCEPRERDIFVPSNWIN